MQDSLQLSMQLSTQDLNKPVRIIFFSDTHLGAAHTSRPGRRKNHRSEDFTRCFETVVDHAISSKADLLIHGGDLFNRSKPPADIVYQAYEKILQAADELPVLMLAGNHERAQLPPYLFLQHRNIHIFDEPKTFRFSFRGKSFCFGGFPHQKKIRTGFMGLVDRSGIFDQPADYRYLCVHQTVEGARVGPNGYTFRHGDDVISASHIPGGLTAVLSGHIHRQQILDTVTPVVYCGSTERTSFAEADETKSFCELIPTEDHIEFVPLPATPMNSLSVPNELTGSQAQRFIEDWCRCQQHRAVIRIKFETFPGGEVLRKVNKSWLWRLFPDASAIQISVDGGWSKVRRSSAWK
ncbi:MAG: metallophosphoesterase [bacterium]|nr:metallophosphoesterase [Gammaproteobacteria bacterium]